MRFPENYFYKKHVKAVYSLQHKSAADFSLENKLLKQLLQSITVRPNNASIDWFYTRKDFKHAQYRYLTEAIFKVILCTQ